MNESDPNLSLVLQRAKNQLKLAEDYCDMFDRMVDMSDIASFGSGPCENSGSLPGGVPDAGTAYSRSLVYPGATAFAYINEIQLRQIRARSRVFAQTNPESRNVRDPRSMTPAEYDAWYCTAYPSSVAFQIGQALPEARARVVHGVTGATADVLGKLRGVLLALSVVALLGAAIGVTAAMTATVLERRLEAGLMVAIGAARRRVVFFFLSEAALLGGLGGAVGGALGLLAGRWLGAGALGVRVPWTPVLLPFALLLGITVALAASIAPVSRALGRYPAALLKRADA